MIRPDSYLVSPLFLFQDIAGDLHGECQLTRTQIQLTMEEFAALERLHDVGRPLDTELEARSFAARLLFRGEQTFADFLSEELDRQQRKFPLVYEIELTNHCPYRCVMCPRTTEMTRALGHMRLDLFTSIVDEIAPHQQFVTLHHFGESLLYPHLGRAISYARDRGVLAELSVNPPTLTPRRADLLLDAGLATLTISLDSLTPEVYRRVRGLGVDMARVTENLDYLLDQRDRRGSPLIITLQMINLAANEDEQEHYIEHWRDRGFDAVVVRQFSPRDYDVEHSHSLSNEPFGVRRPCKAPWKQLTILWDGRVVPCSLDYDGHIVLGQLGDSTLEQIWNSAAMGNLRTNWSRQSLCNRCARSPFHMLRIRRRLGFAAYHLQDANYRHHRAIYSPGYHERLRAIGHY